MTGEQTREQRESLTSTRRDKILSAASGFAAAASDPLLALGMTLGVLLADNQADPDWSTR